MGLKTRCVTTELGNPSRDGHPPLPWQKGCTATLSQCKTPAFILIFHPLRQGKALHIKVILVSQMNSCYNRSVSKVCLQKPKYKWNAWGNIIYTPRFQRAAKHCFKIMFLSPFDKLCVRRINLKSGPWRLSKLQHLFTGKRNNILTCAEQPLRKGSFLWLKCTKKCHISQRSISPLQQEHYLAVTSKWPLFFSGVGQG